MFRPLLAEKLDFATVEYPGYASPKYDGFRCLIDGLGMPISRNLKPIPNVYVQGKLQELKLPKFDGELLTYTNDKVDDFSVIQSKLTSRSGMPDFRYMVFDQYMMPDEAYITRLGKLGQFFQFHKFKNVRLVDQVTIHDEAQLLKYENECLVDGWEGIMYRSITGRYKFGRSTTKEGILLKLKRFHDSEATIMGIYEFMHNSNESTTDSLGRTVRTSHQANMVPMNKLGGFHVKWNDVEFDLGVGFDDNQRRIYWNDHVVDMVVKFKYQGVGPNGKPRFPVFLGFRDEADLDAVAF